MTAWARSIDIGKRTGALVGALIVAIAPASAYNIEVTGIEVSQAVQNLTNEMPLVAGRRTIVRVYARETTGQMIADVEAEAVFGVGFALEGGGATGYGGNRFSQLVTVRPDGGSRLDPANSFIFDLNLFIPQDESVDTTVPGSFTVSVTVNPDGLGDESDPSDNESEPIARELHFAKSLELHFVPVHLHDPAPDENTEVDPQSPVHEHRYLDGVNDVPIAYSAARHHPVAEDAAGGEPGFGISWQNEPVVPIFHNLDVEWNLRRSADRTAVNERLSTLKAMSLVPLDVVYGMVHADGHAGPFSGWANQGVAWGAMFQNFSVVPPWRLPSGLTLAHEVGHRKGLKHVNCSGDEQSGGNVDPDYPWPMTANNPCSLAEVDPDGYYGLDVFHPVFGLDPPPVLSNDPAESHPNRAFPMMGYRGPQWISPWEYCKLLPEYGVPCDIVWPPPHPLLPPGGESSGPTTDPPSVIALLTAPEHLWIGGLLDLDAAAVSLSPFYRIASVSPGLLDEAIERRREEDASGTPTGWTITLESGAAGTLYTHAIYDDPHPPGHDESGAPLGHVLTLNDLLPFYPGVSLIFVRDPAGQVVATRTVSPSAPLATWIAPNLGTLGTFTLLEWSATDADGGNLVFTVLYSDDSGATWRPLILETRETRRIVDAGLLEDMSGSARARLRVLVTDGVNTGQDTSDFDLTAPNSPPRPFIMLAPEDPVPAGAPVMLDGLGLDKEDHYVPATRLDWNSNLQGPIGSGRSIVRTDLVPGIHDVSLVATDSFGQIASASTTVIVTGAGSVPDRLTDGTPLQIQKLPAGQLVLTWGETCLPNDTDFEVYEGTIGDFESHGLVLCSTGGSRTATLPSTGPGSSYFLVVAHNGLEEGSYGKASDATERPQGSPACRPQSVSDVCPRSASGP